MGLDHLADDLRHRRVFPRGIGVEKFEIFRRGKNGAFAHQCECGGCERLFPFGSVHVGPLRPTVARGQCDAAKCKKRLSRQNKAAAGAALSRQKCQGQGAFGPYSGFLTGTGRNRKAGSWLLSTTSDSAARALCCFWLCGRSCFSWAGFSWGRFSCRSGRGWRCSCARCSCGASATACRRQRPAPSARHGRGIWRRVDGGRGAACPCRSGHGRVRRDPVRHGAVCALRALQCPSSGGGAAWRRSAFRSLRDIFRPARWPAYRRARCAQRGRCGRYGGHNHRHGSARRN